MSLDFSLYMEGGEADFKKSDVGAIREKSSEYMPRLASLADDLWID
jgi:hypothetical protein